MLALAPPTSTGGGGLWPGCFLTGRGAFGGSASRRLRRSPSAACRAGCSATARSVSARPAVAPGPCIARRPRQPASAVRRAAVASASACCSRCGPGRLQRLLLGGDRVLQFLQFGQVGHQALHALHAVLLEVFRVHQRARDARHVLVAQQQAQIRAMAERVGGAQQVGDRGALARPASASARCAVAAVDPAVAAWRPARASVWRTARAALASALACLASSALTLSRRAAVSACCFASASILRLQLGQLLLRRGLLVLALAVLAGQCRGHEQGTQKRDADQAA